jgi:hypothetical protein
MRSWGEKGVSEQLISYVKTVQDMIYAMLLMPIKSIKLGWSSVTFEQGWKNGELVFGKRELVE